ncbi:dimethylamine monooxygenase subunit DmmA family protein [Mycobacterium sp. LTG2003]
MKPALNLTSVPPWATAITLPDADRSGRSWTIIAFGSADDVVSVWTTQLPVEPTVHRVTTDEEARAALAGDLASAVVGWRLMIAGPANACLRLRACALERGVADDEMTIASTEVATRDVQCVHCRAVTTAAVDLESTLRCAGCARTLLVYYHVSRRQGAHLGFMADAEQHSEAVAS